MWCFRITRRRLSAPPARSWITTPCSAMFCICMIPIWPTVSLQIQALAYNTKKMKPADLPKSWEEVANPEVQRDDRADDPMRAGPLSSMLSGSKTQWKDDDALQ